MIGDKIKIEICKEVLQKSGFDKNKDVVDSVANAVMRGDFLFELQDNEVIKFVTWQSQTIDGKKKTFVGNLWIDPRYRNRDSILEIRTHLRNILKDSRWIWFNRKKQKIVERI